MTGRRTRPLTCTNAVFVHPRPPLSTPTDLIVHLVPGGYVVDPDGRRWMDDAVVSTKISLKMKEALRGPW